MIDDNKTKAYLSLNEEIQESLKNDSCKFLQ